MYRYQSFERRLANESMRPATTEDILYALHELIRFHKRSKPDGRLWTWEFTLFGGSETITQTTYDPTTDSYSTQPMAGTGKNTVQLNFVTGKYAGKSVNDVATPFIFPYKPLFAIQVINEIPSGASSGSDIRISLNNHAGDYMPRVTVRSNDSYSTGIQVQPTFTRMSLVNNQPTNTAVDSYVRVIGMS
jgi:hypothetical protein